MSDNLQILSYSDFLANKRWKYKSVGLSIGRDDIHPLLFDFQKDVVLWAVRKGRCALFLDTGLGKTFCQLEWARLIGGRCLIIAPLSVSRQTIREGLKIGINVRAVRDKSEIEAGINITNYEMIDNFDDDIDSIVLDECVAGDTLIDTPLGNVRIQDLNIGDMVFNASGVGVVKKKKKRLFKQTSLVLTSIQGRYIISSMNHPFMTARGWVKAKDLKGGDYVLRTAECMRLVREYIDGNSNKDREQILREILLGEMENESIRDCSESSFQRGSQEDRGKEKPLVQIGKSNGSQRVGQNNKSESHVESRDEAESFKNLERNGSCTMHQRWERKAHPYSSKDVVGTVGERVDFGACCFIGEEARGVSNELQNRYSQHTKENCYRSGRIFSQFPERTGCKEGCETKGIRVDSVAIYESGNHIFDRYRDGSGNVVLWDIEISGHPSFSVNGILVHNSSILKSINGKIRAKILTTFHNGRYKLCCTATPSPNDFIELGNHSHFLGVMSRQEMLSTFFINANKEHTTILDSGKIITQKGSNKGGQEWRLKHHAEKSFFEWLSSWAMVIDHPSNLGYAIQGYDLPPLNINVKYINSEEYHSNDSLFFTGLKGIKDRAHVRSEMAEGKANILQDILTKDSGQWIVWCGLNEESGIVKKTLNGISREVSGADTIEKKVKDLEDFQDGQYQILITKPKIAGMGMNFQNASNMVFYGLNDSWETFYQAIRRCWRFGQKNQVNVYVLLSNYEQEIYDNVMRKDKQNKRLRGEMVKVMKDYEVHELQNKEVVYNEYTEATTNIDGNILMRGDSTERLREIYDNTIDLSVYSPPFADLFVYSNSERDLGNSRGWDEFFSHYDFIIKEVLRVTKPGRLSCVHTSDVPAMANRDGYIGLRDFPGKVIAAHERAGWIFTGRAFVQKNPQAQAIRVKSKALLFVQMQKDSSHSRPALIDQILIFKKPGDNAVPIEPVKNKELNNEKWISWAHGIWTDISESDTLKYYDAREKDDEKHICPLQLGTIERCVKLYSNPKETVLTPFLGIGSEAYMAVKLHRKAIGIELKESYYKIAVSNIRSITQKNELPLFSGAENE